MKNEANRPGVQLTLEEGRLLCSLFDKTMAEGNEFRALCAVLVAKDSRLLALRDAPQGPGRFHMLVDTKTHMLRKLPALQPALLVPVRTLVFMDFGPTALPTLVVLEEKDQYLAGIIGIEIQNDIAPSSSNLTEEESLFLVTQTYLRLAQGEAFSSLCGVLFSKVCQGRPMPHAEESSGRFFIRVMTKQAAVAMLPPFSEALREPTEALLSAQIRNDVLPLVIVQEDGAVNLRVFEMPHLSQTPVAQA